VGVSPMAYPPYWLPGLLTVSNRFRYPGLRESASNRVCGPLAPLAFREGSVDFIPHPPITPAKYRWLNRYISLVLYPLVEGPLYYITPTLCF